MKTGTVKRNKLAIIDHVGVKSGMDCYDLGLLTALHNKGIKTFLFSNVKPSSYYPTTIFKYFETKKTSNFSSLLNFVLAHLKSFLMCKKLGIDVVIIHIFSTYSKEFLQYLLLKIFGLKVITIVHDVSDFLSKDSDKIKQYIYKNSEYLVVHNQYSLSCISEFISPKLRKKISVIPHGNYDGFINRNIEKADARDTLGLEGNKVYLLFFGQIKDVKGLDICIKALPFLPENVCLIIAGKPHQCDYGIYDDLIESLKLGNRVIQHIRFIPNEERDIFFCASDLLILPYRRIYQSGVLLMAMTYGLPVIASDLPPNMEVLSDGVNGFLFKSEDVTSLVATLRFVLNGKKSLSIIGNNATKTVEQGFSWEDISSYYIELLSL